MRASIVIPVGNYKNTVGQTVESALSQLYPDVEVIVVNDGSTDGSLEVLKAFGDRITLITQANCGVSVARNNGFRRSTGAYILPLDADDWIEPDYLTKTIQCMQDPGVGIVATDYQMFGCRNDRVPPFGITLEMEKWDNGLPSCSLIRREAYLQTQGYTQAFVKLGNSPRTFGYEDWSLWLDILKRGWKVAVVNEPLLHYRTIPPTNNKWDVEMQHKQLVKILQSLHPDIY